MADNKTKKRADGKRVSLEQEHEREYLVKAIEAAINDLEYLRGSMGRVVARLRAGFPATTKGKRRGK